jgi:hypothetical protein
MTNLTKTLLRKPTMQASRKILLHGCPRCRGDLFHDDYEDEFVCLQCGRRADPTMIVAQKPAPASITAPAETSLPKAA